MRTLVIVPTYNEKENIERVLREILDVVEADILVIDDSSPDGTAGVVERVAMESEGRVTLLSRSAKSGLGSAYLAGFSLAMERGYAMVCEMDGDGSHEARVLPAMISAVREGNDLAIGSRRVRGGRIIGWGPHRHAMSFGAMTLSRWLLGLRTKDVTSGYRCYNIGLASRLIDQGVQSDGYAFQEETVFLAERFGARIVEVPMVFRDRVAGTSKLGWKEVVQFFSTIVRLRNRRSSR